MTAFASEAFLSAGDSMEVLVQKLHEVKKWCGENVFSSLLSGIHELVQYSLTHREVPKLTPREKECLYWVSEGKTSKEIAMLLFISEDTTISHIAQGMRKLDAHTRSAAITKAIRWGLIQKPEEKKPRN